MKPIKDVHYCDECKKGGDFHWMDHSGEALQRRKNMYELKLFLEHPKVWAEMIFDRLWYNQPDLLYTVEVEKENK